MLRRMKYSKLVSLKVEDDVEREARAQAAAADRTLSNYLRGIIREEVRRRASTTAAVADTRDRDAEAQAHG